MSVLDEIVASTRAELERRKRELPQAALERTLSELDRDDRPVERRFVAALSGPDLAIIAEHKRRSPSAGVLRDGSSVAEIVGAYQRGGAAALSILTEPGHFDGSLDDLRAARTASSLPILRKDFVVDDYQLLEAAAAGADAALLIVAALDDSELRALHQRAQRLGLDALVEVHDRDELERALAAGAELVGVNNRDLRDFSVDVARTHELLELMPAGTTVVSESGFAAREALDELARAGVHAVLIGEALMRAADPETALRRLVGA